MPTITNIHKSIRTKMDIGYDNHKGLEAVLASLRDDPNFSKKAEKLRNTTLKKTLKRQTLKEASNAGFCSLDLMTERITWDELRSKFSMDEIIDFGVDFSVAKAIGLEPKYYGGDAGLAVLKKMNATSDQIKESIESLQHLKDASWSVETAKEAGFTFEELCALGKVSAYFDGTPGWSIKEIVLAYNPTGDEWVRAGFNEKGSWDQQQFQQFVEPKTNKVAIDAYQYKKQEPKESNVPNDYILQFDENKLNLVKF